MARRLPAILQLLFSIFVFAFSAYGQSRFIPQGVEYSVAGTLPGEQVFPALSIKTSGGYLVWQDNRTDEDGLGISALRLDSSFSGVLSSFRVNQEGALHQENARPALLNGGGAVFVWQGGRQSFQHIYARFLSSNDTWVGDEIQVSAPTNRFQATPAVATLSDGSVVVVWGSFNQVGANSLQDIYGQRLSPTGQKLGGEFLVNQFTANNQRSAAIAPLSDGRFVVVWISEEQQSAISPGLDNINGVSPEQIGAPSVDVYARIYDANGVPQGDEFLVNPGVSVCANPSVAPSSDGGFAVAWGEKDQNPDARPNGWDVLARPFSGGGFGGVARRVNTQIYGDQYSPRITAAGSDYLVVWTSMSQDGAREGVYSQFLSSDGSLAGGESRVNTTTLSQQMHPALASDGNRRFVVMWTSFVGGPGSFDLFAQRYAATSDPLPTPAPPYVTVLSSSSLSVTWPAIAGFNLANYEVYADGAATATAVVPNNMWNATSLAPGSSHSYRLSYVLADGRRSPLSGATTNATYSSISYFGIPADWMGYYFGEDWPAANADSDGDGASDKNEFLAGTDPTDAQSVLRVRLQPTAQGLFLNWNTERGLIYQVQTSANFTTWLNLGLPRFAAGNVDSVYVGGPPANYYRILRLR